MTTRTARRPARDRYRTAGALPKNASVPELASLVVVIRPRPVRRAREVHPPIEPEDLRQKPVHHRAPRSVFLYINDAILSRRTCTAAHLVDYRRSWSIVDRLTPCTASAAAQSARRCASRPWHHRTSHRRTSHRRTSHRRTPHPRTSHPRTLAPSQRSETCHDITRR